MLAALRRVLTILTIATVWFAAFAAPSHAAPPKKPPPPVTDAAKVRRSAWRELIN